MTWNAVVAAVIVAVVEAAAAVSATISCVFGCCTWYGHQKNQYIEWSAVHWMTWPRRKKNICINKRRGEIRIQWVQPATSGRINLNSTEKQLCFIHWAPKRTLTHENIIIDIDATHTHKRARTHGARGCENCVSEKLKWVAREFFDFHISNGI